MQRTVRRGIDFLKPRLHQLTLATLVGLIDGLWSLPASAGFALPALPESFPALGFSNGFSALRAWTQNSIGAQDPEFPPALVFTGFSTELDNQTRFTSTYNDTWGGSYSNSVVSNTTVANVSASYQAAFGQLRAASTASIAGGPSWSISNAVVEFVDMIQIKSLDPNQSDLNFDLDWKVGGTVGPQGFARGEFWMIDVTQDLPRAHQFITGAVYSRSAFLPGLEVSDTIGGVHNLAVGSRYWVYGRLTINAETGTNLGVGPDELQRSSTTDFLNTAQLFIDPSDDTPWAYIESASGYDYRTSTTSVPEPHSFVILAGGLLTGLARVVVRNRRRRE